MAFHGQLGLKLHRQQPDYKAEFMDQHMVAEIVRSKFLQ